MKNGLQSMVRELIDVLQENAVEIYGDETVSAASDYVKQQQKRIGLQNT